MNNAKTCVLSLSGTIRTETNVADLGTLDQIALLRCLMSDDCLGVLDALRVSLSAENMSAICNIIDVCLERNRIAYQERTR